jgi:hypothetical protein
MSTLKERTRAEAIERLKEWGITPGDTIYVINRHTAASGMNRSLTFYKIENDQPVWLTYQMAKAGIGRWNDKRETLDMGGCGMDMGFAAVYELSRLLFPDGHGCTGVGCVSNDHFNGDRDYTPHVQLLPTVTGHWHQDAGYALKHRWLS